MIDHLLHSNKPTDAQLIDKLNEVIGVVNRLEIAQDPLPLLADELHERGLDPKKVAMRLKREAEEELYAQEQDAYEKRLDQIQTALRDLRNDGFRELCIGTAKERERIARRLIDALLAVEEADES